jgi:hypothetical protein
MSGRNISGQRGWCCEVGLGNRRVYRKNPPAGDVQGAGHSILGDNVLGGTC